MARRISCHISVTVSLCQALKDDIKGFNSGPAIILKRTVPTDSLINGVTLRPLKMTRG